jgi:hypothetical protein
VKEALTIVRAINDGTFGGAHLFRLADGTLLPWLGRKQPPDLNFHQTYTVATDGWGIYRLAKPKK